MGRSQVERNRIKGRPGRGGRGRGSSSGGGGGRGSGGGGGTNNYSKQRKRSGPDPRTLGDNAYRFERNTNRSKDDGNGSSNSDMLLLDDYNTGLLLGSDYYGASHYDMQQEDDDEYTEMRTIPNSSENSTNDSWMAVDISALTTCLKQLPLHERLDVPYHVGRHIESRFGADNAAAAGKKKTLAELREESKCIIVSNETVDEGDDNQTLLETKESKADDSGDNDGDDDDLDAWLDDMIS